MVWLIDLLYFLTAPLFLLFLAILTFKGQNPKQFKIVKETNSLGEEKYELWFEYPVMPFNPDSWRKEGDFKTVAEADQYIKSLTKTREVVKQGII